MRKPRRMRGQGEEHNVSPMANGKVKDDDGEKARWDG